MPKKQVVDKGLQFTKDQFGKEILLKDGGLPVVMEWEKSYMQACIDALKPKGNVLEIGFGLGYSATQIQKYKPQSHTIIECDPAASQKAIEWGRQYPNITIIIDTWQARLPGLGIYDSIFFDDYMPMSQEEVKQLTQGASEFEGVAESTLALREAIGENLKRCKGVKFNDEALRDFANQVKRQPNIQMKDVLNFVDRLEEWGNITKAQKTKFLKEFSKTAMESPSGTTAISSSLWTATKQFASDHFIAFAEECLNRHMHPGSRLSAYIGQPESKKSHPGYQKLIGRKDVKYTESVIKVDVPANCPYYKGKEALVIVLEKK